MCDDAGDEAKLVIKEITDVLKAGTARGNVAVLYRSNLQARPIEAEHANARHLLIGQKQRQSEREVRAEDIARQNDSGGDAATVHERLRIA